MDTEKEALIDSENIKPIYPYKLSLESFGNLFKDTINEEEK